MSASPSWVGASSPPASRYTYLRPSPPVSDRSVPLITRLRTASLLSPRISAASLSVTLLVANLSPPRLLAHLAGILPLPSLAQALRRQPRGCVMRTSAKLPYYTHSCRASALLPAEEGKAHSKEQVVVLTLPPRLERHIACGDVGGAAVVLKLIHQGVSIGDALRYSYLALLKCSHRGKH